MTLVNLDFHYFYNKKNVENNITNKFTELENKQDKFLDLNVNILVEKISNITKNFICFKENFTIVFYLIGLTILAYISHHLYYIINKDHDYISFAEGN